VAGVLAAVCGQAMAAPISLLSRTDLPEPQLLAVSEFPVETRLMSSLEFPEVPETVFAEEVTQAYRVTTHFRMVAADPAKGRSERVPEPPTTFMFTAALLFGGSALLLRRRILKQGHRSFRRRVRRERQLMA